MKTQKINYQKYNFNRLKNWPGFSLKKQQEMSFKKTISGVCKGHLNLFLIRFVHVYMKLKGTNKHQSRNHITTWSKEMHRSHSIGLWMLWNAGFHNNLRSTYLSPLRRANNTKIRTVLTLFARSLNGNPTT